MKGMEGRKGEGRGEYEGHGYGGLVSLKGREMGMVGRGEKE